MSYNKTVTETAISYKGESPVFGESTIKVCIDDDAAGGFIVLKDTNGVELRLDLEQLELVVDVARDMIAQYETNNS